MAFKKIVKWIILTIAFFALIRLLYNRYVYWRIHEKICIESHTELYVEQPISVVIGGGQYGGGIGIPLGDGIVKEREICDKWEIIKK